MCPANRPLLQGTVPALRLSGSWAACPEESSGWRKRTGLFSPTSWNCFHVREQGGRGSLIRKHNCCVQGSDTPTGPHEDSLQGRGDTENGRGEDGPSPARQPSPHRLWPHSRPDRAGAHLAQSDRGRKRHILKIAKDG